MNITFREMNAPASLEKNILSAIEHASARENLKRKIAAFGALIVSFAASIEVFIYLFGQFKKSGFFEYTSLLLSDWRTVINNFGAFSLSIIDSTPFFAITLALLSLLAILASVRFVSSLNQKFVLSKIS